MYPSVPLWVALLFVAIGLWVLTWSADKFVDGAEAVARSFGVSPFVIGMVIIGFGTSAPELASGLCDLVDHFPRIVMRSSKVPRRQATPFASQSS